MVMKPAKSEMQCPLCGGANECRLALGCLYKGPCWCEAPSIPAHVLRHLASLQAELACLCGRCLGSVARLAASCDRPGEILERARATVSAAMVVFANLIPVT